MPNLHAVRRSFVYVVGMDVGDTRNARSVHGQTPKDINEELENALQAPELRADQTDMNQRLLQYTVQLKLPGFDKPE